MATVQRTMFAAKAMDFAQLFKSLLGPATLDTSIGPYQPELSTPEGESTGGGVQIVQHIKLMPKNHDGATFVMGSVNAKEKTCELRTHANFAQMLERRFRGDGPVADEASYEALLKKVNNFVVSQSVAVTMKDVEPERPVAAPARTASRGTAPHADAGAEVQPGVGAPSSAPKFMITVVTAVVALAIALAVMVGTR